MPELDLRTPPRTRSDLLDWLDNPSPTSGITTLEGRREERFVSYERLASDVRQLAGAMRLTVPQGAPILLCQSGGTDFVASFFAALLAGATVSILSPPEAFTERGDYDNHARDLLDALRPALVVSDNSALDERTVNCPKVVSVDELRATPASPIETTHHDADDALIQFTSGSSGRARGVRISGSALAANVAMIRQWLGLSSEDTTISWLPMHHDMGLVGCMITPVTTQSSLDLLTPAQFIRSPLRYLTRFDGKSSVTAAPTFGLDYILRRVKPDDVQDLDLSGLRSVIVGAERVGRSTVDAFAQLLEPAGFRRAAICPAYGLAEATLAVTGSRLDEDPLSLLLDDGTDLVSCGSPLGAATRVSIEDTNGCPVDDRELGEIIVRSPSIATAYLETRRSSNTRIVDGVLHTGDIGTMINGELFVVGRAGDSVKVRGVAVFAEDLEQTIATAGLTRRERVVALVGTRPDASVAIRLLLEGAVSFDQAGSLPSVAQLRQTCDLRIFAVDKGVIRRTSSGKPRRQVMWAELCDSQLGTDITSKILGIAEPA